MAAGRRQPRTGHPAVDQADTLVDPKRGPCAGHAAALQGAPAHGGQAVVGDAGPGIVSVAASRSAM